MKFGNVKAHAASVLLILSLFATAHADENSMKNWSAEKLEQVQKDITPDVGYILPRIAQNLDLIEGVYRRMHIAPEHAKKTLCSARKDFDGAFLALKSDINTLSSFSRKEFNKEYLDSVRIAQAELAETCESLWSDDQQALDTLVDIHIAELNLSIASYAVDANFQETQLERLDRQEEKAIKDADEMLRQADLDIARMDGFLNGLRAANLPTQETGNRRAKTVNRTLADAGTQDAVRSNAQSAQ